MIRNKDKTSAKKQGERGGTLRDLRGVKRRNRNENVFARPNGLRQNAEKPRFSCRGPGPARKKNEILHALHMPAVEGRREKMHTCEPVAKQ